MIKTLNTEIYKIKSKRGLLIFVITLISLSMLFSAIFTTFLENAGLESTPDNWNKAGNISLYSMYFLIATVALTNLVLASDYIKGNINTQIISGSNRAHIYLSKMMVLSIAVVVSLIISVLTIIITMGLVSGFGNWSTETYKEMINVFVRLLVHLLPFVGLYGIIGLLIKSEAVASILSFLSITFLILIARFLTRTFNLSEKFIEYLWINLEHLDFKHEESFKGWIISSIIVFFLFLIIGTYIAKRRDYN